MSIRVIVYLCVSLVGVASAVSDCPVEPTDSVAFAGSDVSIDAEYAREGLSLDMLHVYDLEAPNACCVDGTGERKLLRFGFKLTNRGENAFELGAPPPEIDPCTSEGVVGNWTWSLCSHKPVWKRTAMYSVDLFDTEGHALVRGGYRDLCIRDDSCDGDVGRLHDCAFQGLGVDCSSEYPSNRHCQWIDITGTPDGAYLLELTLDPTGEFGRRPSSDKSRVLVRLGDVPSYVPYNTHRVVGIVIGFVTVAVVLTVALLP